MDGSREVVKGSVGSCQGAEIALSGEDPSQTWEGWGMRVEGVGWGDYLEDIKFLTPFSAWSGF